MTNKDILKYNLITNDNNENEVLLFIGSPNNQRSFNLYWLKSLNNYDLFKIGYLIINEKDYLMLKSNNKINPKIKHLITKESTRYIFAKIVTENFPHLGLKYKNEVNWYKSLYSKDVFIGENVYIGENVEIGKGSKIYNNVIIHNNTKIGKNCIIKENSVIGSEGMGYELTDDGWYKFPQIGKVVIGNDVEINTFCDIKRGALEDTIISDGCKIGSYCNIGHNTILGENSLLTSHCVIAGSVKTGVRFWMGINSSIRNGITIGDDVILGANSYINKNVEDKRVIKTIY
jgi:UDP-3-O-[3-hydroxymyristoyl] glucosamine N-acyltransferase